VPGYPLTPALFVAASAGVVVNTVFTQLRVSVVGVVVMLLGVPAFHLWRRRTLAPSVTPIP